MAGYTRVIYNSLEQAISSDLNRNADLRNREAQDVLRGSARARGGIESADLGTLGSPINGLDLVPTWDGVAATFDSRVGAGQGYVDSATGVGANDSQYQVIRWPQQDLTHAAPDGANDRIDLITVAIGSQDTDLVSRNILVDPATRTVAAQNVNKTRNPLSTLQVVSGTAAASPVPPAVPAGQVALFEVLVPTGVADSTSFSPARRLFRRVSYPTSAGHGVREGCVVNWTSSGVISLASDYNAVVVDGEMVEFGLLASTAVFSDTSNDPFAVAAGATACKPYYLYICGGRHSPQRAGTGPPVIIVESLTAPDLFGRASSALGGPRGSIPEEATVYIGLGAVDTGGTSRAALVQDGDWFTAAEAMGSTPTPFGPLRNWEYQSGLALPSTHGLTNPPAFGSIHPVVLVTFGLSFAADTADSSAVLLVYTTSSTNPLAHPQFIKLNGASVNATVMPTEVRFSVAGLFQLGATQLGSGVGDAASTWGYIVQGYKALIPRA